MSEPPLLPDAPGDAPVQVLIGSGAVFLGHTLMVLCCLLVGVAFATDHAAGPIFAIGVSQLLYVVPLLWLARKRGRHGLFWGALGAAALTLLLNGGCWGIVLDSFSGI